jgi:hypothetical protein
MVWREAALSTCITITSLPAIASPWLASNHGAIATRRKKEPAVDPKNHGRRKACCMLEL